MNQSLSHRRPLVSVDLAIFSMLHGDLSVLLVKRRDEPFDPHPGLWTLPGGLIDTNLDKDLEHCAQRRLKEKTGVRAPYVEQVGSWGSASRDPRGWSTTHLYFSLIAEDEASPISGGNADELRWAPLDGSRVRGKLAFDHSDLLKAAVGRLRGKAEYTSVPAFLMPAEFTLGELQRAYEIVLNRTLEKKAFRTRMLATDLLESTPRYQEGPNRPARLFRLTHKRRPFFFTRPFRPR